jgi:antitoxin (DNA-binding transcriptional repressor) of toxin-antitoxin stability system
MDAVSKSYLKTHMLRLFREIERSGEELIVTDNKKPVLKITAIKSEQSIADVFAGLRGQVHYGRSIDAPTRAE